MDTDGYPVYHRHETDTVHCLANGQQVDNKDVVSHNPYLTRMFDCHINVELCAGVQCVKYIHKYIYKGHDLTTLVFYSDDEIQQYFDTRYIGPPETAWYLFRNSLDEENLSVTRLALHLPRMYNVVYDEREPIENVISRAQDQRSTLAGFFKYCATNNTTTTYIYQQFPEFHAWHEKPCKWLPRVRPKSIGRIYFAPPNYGERYYLRLLLTVIKNLHSFEHLQNVNGVLHNTLKVACVALGLLKDDKEWIQCLEKLVIMPTGYQLRRLFAVILIHCSLIEPMGLWIKFSMNICDELKFKLKDKFGIPNSTKHQITNYDLF